MSRCSPGCAPAQTWCRSWRRPPSSAATSIAACWARCVDLSEDDVDDVIDELEDALVLEPWGADGWRFRHELLREVAVELAPPERAPRAARQGGGRPGRRRRRPRLGPGRRPLRARRAVRRRRLGIPAGIDRRPPPGALAEARGYLTPCPRPARPCHPGPDRDRREISVRLERGFSLAAAEGGQSRAAAADFERCLQLGGTDLRDDELFATLLEVVESYVMRAELRRARQLLESLRGRLPNGSPFHLMVDTWPGSWPGSVASSIRPLSQLEEATAGCRSSYLDIDVYPCPGAMSLTELSAYNQLVLAPLMRGDLAGAEAALRTRNA